MPGLVSGATFGIVLWHRRLLSAARALIYLAAATFANAAAVFAALFVVDPLTSMIGEGAAIVVSGIIAGALGGGLLAGVTTLLLPIAGWWLLMAAGSLLGAALPILVDGEDVGAFVFYALWQGGYAAALAASLPRLERS